MTVLYPIANLCYNKVCYKGTGLYERLSPDYNVVGGFLCT